MNTPSATPAPGQAHAAYRYDVEGLRALAVVPVVLFHAGVRGFSGGYVGVDVFFVISGYLITQILLREVAAGQFSLLGFYRRRILRIFPNLFAMLLVSSLLAIALLLPSELARFGASLLAALGFVSNIYFYFTTDYFHPHSATAPLVHTWSLSLEEQFYLAWPLVLAFLYRAGTRLRPRLVTLALALASFAAGVLVLRGDPQGAFYGIHTRAWELLIGAFIAQLPPGVIRSRWLRELLCAAGIVLIVACVLTYKSETSFPGLNALWPCLGAALVIVAGHGGGASLGARALSLPPMVRVGQLSFSLYLWHWPVIVFASVGLFQPASLALQLAEMGAAFVAAALAWRYVEQPFRAAGGRRIPTAKVFGAALASSAAFALLAGVVLQARGFPERLPDSLQRVAAFESYDGDRNYRGGGCFVNRPGQIYPQEQCLVHRPGALHLLLVGDSHAAHLWPGLVDAMPGVEILQANRIGCAPALRQAASQLPPCQLFYQDVLMRWLPAHRVDAVVLAGRWTQADLAHLQHTLHQVTAHAPVVLVGPVPEYAAALPRLLVQAHRQGDAQLVQRHRLAGPFALDQRMREIASHSRGTLYVSMTDLLCATGSCRTYAAPDVPLQFDYGHFTTQGSRLVADLLAREIRPVLVRAPATAAGE